MPKDPIAKGLGLFSLALGIPQLVAPGRLNSAIGVDDSAVSRALQRAVGLREVATGVGILTSSRPAGWLKARVAGDAIDLALLGAGLVKGGARRRVLLATAAVAGVAVADVLESLRTSGGGDGGPLRVRTAATVNRPPSEVYAQWRDFPGLPRFMYHLESVEVTGERQSHWIAKGPAGSSVEWDAEITEDRPGELIAWQSLPGAQVPNRGSVRFTRAPANQGTEVLVEIEYEPPAGRIGATIAWLFGENPEQQVKDDLRRFKQIVETGQVVLSEGSPDGTRTQRQLKQREAQPLTTV